jgi:hypothetical protein
MLARKFAAPVVILSLFLFASRKLIIKHCSFLVFTLRAIRYIQANFGVQKCEEEINLKLCTNF